MARYQPLGCELWGIDFSQRMLALAQQRLNPAARLIAADLTAQLPQELKGSFDICVSSYVFHEFDDPAKLALVRTFCDRLQPGGILVIGDISFPDRTAHDLAREEWSDRWDHSEHYWCAAEALEACDGAGIAATYRQLSGCAGVYTMSKR